MLITMKAANWRIRRQSADNSEIDIRIGAVNIRIAMVGDNMLPMPAVGARPEQIKRHREHLVCEPGTAKRPVTGVVRDIECNSSQAKT
jgi:hypothetical protein